MATTSRATIQAPSNSTFESRDLLYLFLGLLHKHDIVSSSCWEYLTLSDLWKVRLLNRSLFYHDLRCVKYNRCRDGYDYHVPFPGFPGLLATRHDMIVASHGGSSTTTTSSKATMKTLPLTSTTTSSPGLYSHQLASLAAMHEMENSSQEFGALRGGVSCGGCINRLGVIDLIVMY
jgi:hypothetical protein